MKKLKQFLKEKDIKEFAKKLGLATDTVHSYLRGARRPSLVNAFKIERATRGKVMAKDFI